jgi:hypothetical protein
MYVVNLDHIFNSTDNSATVLNIHINTYLVIQIIFDNEILSSTTEATSILVFKLSW